MIADPIICKETNDLGKRKTFRELCEANRGKILFILNEEETALSLWKINDFSGAAKLFMIRKPSFNFKGDRTFKSDYYKFPREEFFDEMRKNYPNHLEWMLYHREWLF